jgi:hypothetical protein
MSEKGHELELSDEQREEVRRMLEKFGTKKEKQASQKKAHQKDQRRVDPDPLESSPPGSTIEWHELTPKTRRYQFVRESRALFVPYILDKIFIPKEKFEAMVYSAGLDVTSQNAALTVCAIDQADPIRVFQIQTTTEDRGIRIETIRYIV